MAERMVCGSAMYLAPAAIMEAAHVVDRECFLDPTLGAMWAIEVQLAMAEKAVTPLTVNYVFNQLTLPEINELFDEAWLHAGRANLLAHAGIVAKQGERIREFQALQGEVKDRIKDGKAGWWQRFRTTADVGESQ